MNFQNCSLPNAFKTTSRYGPESKWSPVREAQMKEALIEVKGFIIIIVIVINSTDMFFIIRISAVTSWLNPTATTIFATGGLSEAAFLRPPDPRRRSQFLSGLASLPASKAKRETDDRQPQRLSLRCRTPSLTKQQGGVQLMGSLGQHMD